MTIVNAVELQEAIGLDLHCESCTISFVTMV